VQAFQIFGVERIVDVGAQVEGELLFGKLKFASGFGTDFMKMCESESERRGKIGDQLGSGDFRAGSPDRENGGAFGELPPFVGHIVKMELGTLREADLRAAANPFAVRAGFDALLGLNGEAE